VRRAGINRSGRGLDSKALREPARLAAVDRARHLLASTHLPVDHVVRLAARAVDVPLAAIGLFDTEREHFFCVYGADVAAMPAETSFCRHVVTTGLPLIIDNVDAAGEPLVPAAARAAGIRAFASFPIHFDGAVIGSICAAAREVRHWSPEHLAALSDSAQLVSRILDGAAGTPEPDAQTRETDAQTHETDTRTRQAGRGSRQAASAANRAPGAAAVRRPPADAPAGADVATEVATEVVAALDALREAFLALDRDGAIRRWSAGAEATFGWTAAETVGGAAEPLLIGPRSRNDFRAAWRRATRTDHPVPQHLKVWVRYRDGHEFPADASITTTGPAGGPVYLFLREASERVAAEQENTRQRAFLGALLEALESSVVACDAQGRLLLFNSTLRNEYGDTETAPSDFWPIRFDVRYPDGRPMPPAELPLIRALAGEVIADARFMVRVPGQPDHIVSATGRQLRSPDGDVLGAVLGMHEVTELVRANRLKDGEVTASRLLQRNGPLTDTAPEVLSAVLAALQWQYAELWLTDDDDDTALRLIATATGPASATSSAADPDGAPPVATGVPAGVPASGAADGPADAPEVGKGLAAAALARGAPQWLTDQAQVVPAGGGTGLRSAVAVPIRSAEQTFGVLTAFATTAEDRQEAVESHLSGIATHLGLYIERRRSSRLATELARTKDDYVGLVGHELRTPLTSISAYTDLLMEEPDLDDEHRSMVAVVQRNAATLRDIITALLDLAAFESGHATLRLRPTDIREVAREAVEAIGPVVTEHGVTVVTALDTPMRTAADGPRLRQMVDILLANAVRYTPAGGTITLDLHRDGDVAVLSVSDTGVGIPPAERARLFDRFGKGSAGRGGSPTGRGGTGGGAAGGGAGGAAGGGATGGGGTGGGAAGARPTGADATDAQATSGGPADGAPGRRSGIALGLAIARAIAMRHDGTLTAADNDEPGATFVLRLPVLR
jgi:PAS domain S-box-containing protein